MSKTFVHNIFLQTCTVLHYFGELIAIGMAVETEDSILVKEGRVEISFLFHPNCIICLFRNAVCIKKNHDSIHIKNI